MILGLDVSSSKIGYCIIDKDENLLLCEFKKFKTSTSLESRALEFHSTLLDLSKKFKISKVMIEAPFVAFGGGRSSAQTVATLQRFNGMISLLVPIVFDMESEMVTPAASRKKQGIKIPRGQNTKKMIIEWVAQRYPDDFIVELTRHGNPKPGTDDMADSVLVALAAL
jgi:Holliday junction resolvasome RuvABC endonuclease subunit